MIATYSCLQRTTIHKILVASQTGGTNMAFQRFAATMAIGLVLLLCSCGGGGGGGGGGGNVAPPSNNWDSMVWDQGSWG
jgi:hypothetical protein